MKKIILCFAIIAMLVSATGCDGEYEQVETSSQQYTTSIDDSSEASSYQDVVWEIDYYEDEFGDPTGKSMICNESSPFIGTFSNSATTNSKLAVYVIIDAEYTQIQLLEYGTNLVKTSYSDGEWYVVAVKDSYGNRKELYGLLAPGIHSMLILEDKSLSMNTSDYIEQKLKEGQDLSLYIYEEERPGTNYSFKIIADNFSELA